MALEGRGDVTVQNITQVTLVCIAAYTSNYEWTYLAYLGCRMVALVRTSRGGAQGVGAIQQLSVKIIIGLVPVVLSTTQTCSRCCVRCERIDFDLARIFFSHVRSIRQQSNCVSFPDDGVCYVIYSNEYIVQIKQKAHQILC
jgi:hypothetical protein